MDFVYHTFVPVCTLKDRNSEAPISLFVENVNIGAFLRTQRHKNINYDMLKYIIFCVLS